MKNKKLYRITTDASSPEQLTFFAEGESEKSVREVLAQSNEGLNNFFHTEKTVDFSKSTIEENERNYKKLFDIDFGEGYAVPAYTEEEAIEILREHLEKTSIYSLDDQKNIFVTVVGREEWEKYSDKVFFKNVIIDGSVYMKILGSVKEGSMNGKNGWICRQYRDLLIKADDWMNLSRKDKIATEIFGESDYTMISEEDAKATLTELIDNAYLL